MDNLTQSRWLLLFTCCLFLFFTACFKGDGLEPFIPPTEIRIDATVPSVLYTNKKEIYLDARRTLNMNGPRELFFLWTCTKYPVGGPPGIDHPQSAMTTAGSFYPGNYIFNLKVTDAKGHEAYANFNFEVKQDTLTQGPKMVPLPDQFLYLPRNILTLNASSAFTVNPDGRDLKFLWSLTQQPSGSSRIIFNDSTRAAVQVEGFMEGVYQFRVEITNELGLSVADTMGVTVMKDTLPGKIKVYEDLVWGENFYWDEFDVWTKYNELVVYDQILFYSRTKDMLDIRVWDESRQDWSVPGDYTWYINNNTVYINRKVYNESLTGRKAKIQVKFL